VTAHPMTGFDPKFATPEQYILGVTNEIWEGRRVETLNQYYAPDIPVRSAAGVVVGNQAVIEATNATMSEFPDRQLLGEDVIWSDDGDGGFLSSHRLVSTATHAADGVYGSATRTKLRYRIIADCAARENTIYDEWLVRDQGAIVRQLGIDPRAYAAAQIEDEGGVGAANFPFTPDADPGPVYIGCGNDHVAGERYADLLQSVMAGDGAVIEAGWDRAVSLELPGMVADHGWEGVGRNWLALRECFPDALFEIHHKIGRVDPGLGERAALRWSLTGTHDGGDLFGTPTGALVHVMGLSHAEFGPRGIRREFVVYDQTAIWKQILILTG